MIDNLKIIQPLLHFANEDDFYYLQLIQRKKENPALGSNSKVIKNYYINNLDYLLDKYDEIKKLCKLFNARAMLRLNKRSYRKVALKTIQNVANSIANGEYAFVKKSYDRACGQGHNDKVKKWIIDIDKITKNKTLIPVISTKVLDNLKHVINSCNPQGNKILLKIPTKNGIHLITTPFNIIEFNSKIQPGLDEFDNLSKPNMKFISIHKDNPTNLYIP